MLCGIEPFNPTPLGPTLYRRKKGEAPVKLGRVEVAPREEGGWGTWKVFFWFEAAGPQGRTEAQRLSPSSYLSGSSSLLLDQATTSSLSGGGGGFYLQSKTAPHIGIPP